jgi:hypothetical protein
MKAVVFNLISTAIADSNNIEKKNLYQRSGLLGVDVIITIFCDFCQFSAKKWRFSHKSMSGIIKFLQKLAVV